MQGCFPLIRPKMCIRDRGYTTTLIVLLLIGSAIMLSLGIIGYYIAKIYEEVKRRPRYIISQILRGKEDVYQEVNHDCSH